MRFLPLALAFLALSFAVRQLQAESEAVDRHALKRRFCVGSDTADGAGGRSRREGLLHRADRQAEGLDPATSQVTEIGSVTITTEQENGLIGMALDPKFAENHWIYLQYSPRRPIRGSISAGLRWSMASSI